MLRVCAWNLLGALRLPAGARLGALMGALAMALCMLGAPPVAARGPAVAGSVAVGSLPREARATYTQILAGGPYAYAKDGITFGNYEGALPKQKRGYYREFTVNTPGARNRGARRIVCGGSAGEWSRNQPAACYYTDDHYVSFRQIRD